MFTGKQCAVRKILIVENSPTHRRLLRNMLKHYGYEVLEAADGREGVSMAMAHLPDLILMDLQMPEMDGFRAGYILRSGPKTRHIKIIALTSFAVKEDRERFMEAGFVDYIAKPINTKELPELLRKYF